MSLDLKKLLKSGFISRKQYRELSAHPVRGGKRLLEILQARGFLDEADREDAASLLQRAKRQTPVTFFWESPQMLTLKERVHRLASSSVPLLIWGEPGVGKNALAAFIHEISPHQTGPLISLSCSTLTPSGSDRTKSEGEEADRLSDILSRTLQKGKEGTVQLKDLGALSQTGQLLLEQIIREKGVENRRKERWLEINARLILSCDRDPRKEMEQNNFLPNLYYTLSAGALYIPPLRDRRDEILPLSEHFVRNIQRDEGIPCRLEDQTLIQILQAYSWPGNIRELETCLQRMAILTDDGNLRIIDLPRQLRRFVSTARMPAPGETAMAAAEAGLASRKSGNSESYDFPSLKEMEQRHIKRALELSGGNVLQAACLLKIHRNTLARKIEEMEISPNQFKEKRRKKANTPRE